MKSANMENLNNEFRGKLKNLLTKFKNIFEGNEKLKDFKSTNFVLMNQYKLLHKD